MKSLPIVWQRLVDSEGQTCDRCSATYDGLRQAVAKLDEVLRPLDINITFETREIDIDSFTADPSQSNRIWIAGKPIEEWIGASVASSQCCSICRDSECRTVELGHDVFEIIPSELVLKAALIAASQLVEPSTRDHRRDRKPACCSD